MRISQKFIARVLINPFGRLPHALEFDGRHLLVMHRRQTLLSSLETMKSAPIHSRHLFGITLTIPIVDGPDIVLRGAPRGVAASFTEALTRAWIEFNIELLQGSAERFTNIHEAINQILNAQRYPAVCLVEPILKDAKALDTSLLSKLPPDAIGPEVHGLVTFVRRFVADPRSIRASSIERFVSTELERWSEFFDTIESKPLTPEQRLAVVVDEDATLVLAGAGSGKTSVITAKAAYLAKSGIRAPEEILLLAFAKNAAAEMSERVEARSGVALVAQTFHALAYQIIGSVEGSKPALAEHATDDMAFLALIKDILKDLVHTKPDVASAVIGWFAHFLVETKTEWDFETKHAFYSHLEKQDLRTLQGERVKSHEELQIANWLYENGILYEYEPLYEHKVSSAGRRDYTPDFRLTESGIYLEHFGVRRNKFPDGTERLATAPFVDRDAYLEGMEWKRQIHATYETTLIETYSYERQEGRLLSALAEKLAPYIELNPRAAKDIFDRVVDMKQVDAFSQLLGTFLRKFKSGGYTIAECAARLKAMKLGKRGEAFLALFAPVFEEYQARLSSRIDFEDMVLRAAVYVESGEFRSPFRHILIDEFQDISQGRARLVRALKAQHSDCRIFAVGDDWQSIFRFAGSDIHIMRHFGEIFGGTFGEEAGIHRTVDLGRTFRSVDRIAFAARDFVLKNPAQIIKQIVPAGTANEPAIRVVLTTKEDEALKLLEVLASLSAGVAFGTASVLLLGRYRFLEPNVGEFQRQFPSLCIAFKSVHASKGLEADHVILLGADSGQKGFPSETVDDALLSLVSPEEETFEYAEERRVMYVAMTRARRTFTVLASNSRPSSFIGELNNEFGKSLWPSTDVEHADHQCGECGGRLLRVRGEDKRILYRCEHVRYCSTVLPACPACGTSLPRSREGSTDATCRCGASYRSCPKCKDGWLVDRSGRYGGFLGCVRYPDCTGKARSATDDNKIREASGQPLARKPRGQRSR